MKRPRPLPKKIKVGYAEYKIRHVCKKADLQKRKKLDLGECDFTNQIIRLFGIQESDEIVNSLFHELLHSVNYVFQIPYKNARAEEKHVRVMANALVTVFKDNPNLLLWLRCRLSPEENKK